MDELSIKQYQKIYSAYHLCRLRYVKRNNSILIENTLQMWGAWVA